MCGSAAAAGREKNLQFYKNTKNEKITKNLKKIDGNQQKRRFWRSYEKTDVTIKFYAKNYSYKLIFKSVRLKIVKNMFLTGRKRLNTIVRVYSGFVNIIMNWRLQSD